MSNLTQKINGVRKMLPTPHHKTSYKASSKSWYIRHRVLFIQLAQEVGFKVIPGDHQLHLKHDIGTFCVAFQWEGESSTIQMYGHYVDETIHTYRHWRGKDKPKSHNDAHLGNWFLKLVREDWIESRKPEDERRWCAYG